MEDRKIDFVWITHNDPSSVAEVKGRLDAFKPDIIGLEITKVLLEKLVNSKHREKSEMYVAYRYAEEKGVKLYLMETDPEREHMLRAQTLFSISRYIFQYVLCNLSRILKLKRPRKLKLKEGTRLWDNVINRRDEIFSKKIKTIISNHKDAGILFIFGKAHKRGITKRLEC